MTNAKAVKQFCNTLDGLQGGITLFKEGLDEFLLSHGYPRYYEQIESIRDGLEDLGLYEEVLDFVKQSEVLVREAKYHEAELLVLEINRKLSTASGAEEDLRKMYKAANE
jgi:hypothetical protein